MSDPGLALLIAPLWEVARAAGWHQIQPVTSTPLPHGTLGVWSDCAKTTELAVGEPDADVYAISAPPRARVALSGALDTARPWSVTGHCPLVVLPDLVMAASFPPDTAASDPPGLLPADLYFRETCTGYPQGQFYSERWLDWGWGAGYVPMLSELEFVVPGPTSASDMLTGWHLSIAGPSGAVLHADPATPRHVVGALVVALSHRSFDG